MHTECLREIDEISSIAATEIKYGVGRVEEIAAVFAFEPQGEFHKVFALTRGKREVFSLPVLFIPECLAFVLDPLCFIGPLQHRIGDW